MREDGQDFIQPANIEAIQGSHGLRFFFVPQKANDFRSVNHNIVSDFPQTKSVLFSWPWNIAETGVRVVWEHGQDFHTSHSLAPVDSAKKSPSARLAVVCATHGMRIIGSPV
jgi:hypothetical protein